MAMLTLYVNAGNDTHGNPRRGWLVWETDGSYVGFVDEGYSGRYALEEAFGDESFYDLGTLDITPSMYRKLKKGAM